jgi:hypothetical protein
VGVIVNKKSLRISRVPPLFYWDYTGIILGSRGGRLLNKTRGQKSHATVPLRTLKANYKIKDNIDKI